VQGHVAARTRQLLEAPILPTLLRLALPNVAVMVIQSAVTVLDAYFVASLGADALAGVALVFPLIMLMQMMSAGGMGGGVSSAVARALGAGRRADADALVTHALVVALAFGVVFTASVLGAGSALYHALGGRERALEAALAYSNVVFAGAAAPWLFNTLASVVRGTGNMVLPATLAVAGGVLHVSLSPALIYGLGPFPRLGMTGAGVALVIASGAPAAVVLAYLVSGRGLVALQLRGVRLRWSLFREILRVGLPAVVTNVMANATVLLLTGLVGSFGTAALAGYGIGARLEYLQIPLVFGMGSALVAMVGTNVGAGQRVRAERVAWMGAGLAAAVTGAIGLAAALAPGAWMGLFTDEAAVAAAGATYLTIVGPTYACFGAGLALYFASQGAGRLFWPVVASVSRAVLAPLGGWIALALGGGLSALCLVMAGSLVVFGATNAVAVKAGTWR